MFNLILSVVLGIIVLVLLAIFINKIPRKLHIVIIVVLLAFIGFFGYKLFQSIAEPVKFEQVKEERYEKVVAQLIRLRDAEVAHKLITGKYTDDIEALAKFIDTAQFALIQKRDSSVTDVDKNKRYGISGTGGYFKEITIIDTLGFKSVKDSLFSSVNIRSLLKYPIDGAPGQITLKKGTVTDGNNQLQVFEAKAIKKDILFDQPERLVKRELEIKAVEAIDGDAIIVGSLEEVSTSGNWPRQYALSRSNQ
jgi:hypothetical protein